jgi:hypothetical protein
LLALEQVERHGIGEMGIEELLLFASEDDQSPLLRSPFALTPEA